MSTLGLLVILLFLISMGGSVLLYYSDSHRVKLARFLILVLYLLIVLEFVIALFEFPSYLIDGIIFVSMGMEQVAKIMLIILGVAVAFVIFILIPKINWRRFLRTTPVKLAVCAVLIIGGLIYTEMYNGIYSFENKDDFYAVRTMYEKYDNGFFPTKFIETDEMEGENEHQISVYPFDVTTVNGKQPWAYKVTLFRRFLNGDYALYYYPFTYKTYVSGASYSMDEIIIPEEPKEESDSDISGSDVSETDTDTTTGDGEEE